MNRCKKLLVSVMVGCCLFVMVSSFTAFASDCDHIREKVFRLHILANSNSEEDQAVKLGLRDAVIQQYGHLFALSDSKEELIAYAKEHRTAIEDYCNEFLALNGIAQTAAVQIVNDYFPTREYEQFTLPAGDYDALRILIGDAQGKNWWCVMFPQLCVPAAVDTNTVLGHYFTASEAEAMTQKNNYTIKFAAYELWKELF